MIGRPHASMRAWQGVVDLQIPEPKIGTGALNTWSNREPERKSRRKPRVTMTPKIRGGNLRRPNFAVVSSSSPVHLF